MGFSKPPSNISLSPSVAHFLKHLPFFLNLSSDTFLLLKSLCLLLQGENRKCQTGSALTSCHQTDKLTCTYPLSFLITLTTAGVVSLHLLGVRPSTWEPFPLCLFNPSLLSLHSLFFLLSLPASSHMYLNRCKILLPLKGKKKKRILSSYNHSSNLLVLFKAKFLEKLRQFSFLSILCLSVSCCLTHSPEVSLLHFSIHSTDTFSTNSFLINKVIWPLLVLSYLTSSSICHYFLLPPLVCYHTMLSCFPSSKIFACERTIHKNWVIWNMAICKQM